MSWTKVGETSGVASNSSGGTNFSLPAGIAEGDIVIVGVACNERLTSDGIQTSGYTTIVNPATDSPGRQLAYKVMGSTPDTVVNVRGRVSSGIRAPTVVQTWRGGNATVLDATSVSVSGGAGMPNGASITTATANALVFAFGSLDDDEVSDGAAPSGYSNFLSSHTNSAGFGERSSVFIASKQVASPGAENPAAFGGTGSDDWAAVTFALRIGTEVTALTAADVTNGNWSLDTPAISQVHAVVADDLTGAAWTVDEPLASLTLTPTADPITNEAWSIDSPLLFQVHVLSVLAVTHGITDPYDFPPMAQVHTLTGADLFLSAPALDQPYLTGDITAIAFLGKPRLSLSLGLRIG